MELSEGGSLESYLKKTLYFHYLTIPQSGQAALEMDNLLKILLRSCQNILSAMVHLESKNVSLTVSPTCI